jgi:hypothetical protein
MAKWAQDNLTEFYRIYARLIPVEQRLGNPEGGPTSLTVQFVKPTWPLPKTALDEP